MSSMLARHREMLEDLFEMRGGFFLDFDNSAFKRYMILNANIDVYTAPGYVDESSKAKKFRYFVSNEPDELVGRVILDLLHCRSDNIIRRRAIDDEYTDQYSEFVTEIELIAQAMCSGAAAPRNDEERLNATMLEANQVFQKLKTVSEQMCNTQGLNYSKSENEINDYYRNMLSSSGYFQVMDQTRHGISSNGRDAGEVDLLLKKNDREAAIFEGLKLDSVNSQYIKNHIDKAIVNYNALGTPTFIVAYAGTVNFEGFWNRYFEFLAAYSYPLNVKRMLVQIVSTSAAIRSANMILSRDGFDFPVYFMAVNLRQ